MAEFDLSSFDTFNLPERRRELLNTPVSEELLRARAQTERMINQYNGMNMILGAMGKRTSAPMAMPTYDDSPSTSDVAATDEQAAIEFMRSLDKIREQAGRDLTESERNALARAYGLGPKGLATLEKYFKYIGKTDADLRDEAREQRAISAEQRAIAQEQRASKTFEQGQEDRITADNDKTIKGHLLREAYREFRGLQDDGSATLEEQQRIKAALITRAQSMGYSGAELGKSFDDLMVKAPPTKEVLDSKDGQVKFRTEYEIRESEDRYTPVRDSRGQLSSGMMISAYSTFDELKIDLEKGVELIKQMNNLGVNKAIEVAIQDGKGNDAELMRKILVTMGKNKKLIDMIIERSLGGSAQITPSGSEMIFESVD